MNLISNKDIVVRKRVSKKSTNVSFFEISEIESYLNLKKFVFEIKKDKKGLVLLVLSNQNEGYKIYRGGIEYQSAFDMVINIFKNSLLYLKKKDDYYIVFNKKDFLELEEKLYEVCLLFRFSSFMGIKSNINNEKIISYINKFSFHGTHSYKKWEKVVDWKLFFDGEHLSGSLTSSSKSD